jgi:hypothetical protein
MMVAELLGATLGAVLMAQNLWLPLLLSFACAILTALLAASLPETLYRHQQAPPGPSQADEDESPAHPTRQGMRKDMAQVFQHTSATFAFIARHRSVLYLVVTFLVVDYARASLGILVQYLSTRYAIPIAQASLLLSFRAFTQLVAFVVILPALDALVPRLLHLTPRGKDFALARLSVAFAMASFAVLVIAPSIWMVVLGTFFPCGHSMLRNI